MTALPEHQATILVVDDTPTNLRVVSAFLDDAGFKVLVAEDGNAAREVIRRAQPDLLLLDVLMPDPDGFTVCQQLKADPETQEIPIIFMTALSQTEDKVKGFEAGGVDYITKPFNQEEVLARVRTHLALRELRRQLQARTTQLEEQNSLLQAEIDAHTRTKGTVHYLKAELDSEREAGAIEYSASMQETLDQVAQAAPTDCTVLIVGETGTGKEYLARAVHKQSPRSAMPMIKVNCAAIPKDLFESEFFGHEKGAFTGASAKRVGRFELAHGGTLFLDEIGELPLDIQAKLLRVLQEQEFERVGGHSTQKVDVRIVAATNRNLQEEVASKRFREDLYYRLNVFPVHIPPLRDRHEDLPMLIDSIVKKFSQKHGKSVEGVQQASMSELVAYTWPGNIRELENVIERAVILTKDSTLQIGNWFGVGVSSPPSAENEVPLEESSPSLESIESLEEMERLHILRALEATKWRIAGQNGAAELLGVNRSTLRARMDKLGISREGS